MLRTFLRQSLVIVAAVTLFLPVAIQFQPAHAATISFTDANCGSFGLTNNGSGSFTLTCQSLTCSIAATSGGVADPNPLPTDQVTLTASCNGDASTTWNWTAGVGNNASCPTMTSAATANPAQLTVPNTNVSSCAYTVTASDGANGGGTATATLSYSNTITKPSGCTTSPASSSQSSGYQTTFSVSCTGGSSPTAWAWSGPGTASCVNTSSSCGPVTFTSTGTVSVTPSNSAGNGNAASSTITIGGGGGGPINCPGYATTWTVDAQWLGGVGWVYNTWGNNPEFGSQDMYVVRIAVPAGVNATGFGSMNAIENNGPPAGRYGSLSTLPCDLTGTGLIVKTDGVAPAFTPANGNAPPAINIWVGTAQAKHTVLLQGGVTYYYNITNFNLGTGASTCIPGPTCDMRFTLFKPPGT